MFKPIRVIAGSLLVPATLVAMGLTTQSAASATVHHYRTTGGNYHATTDGGNVHATTDGGNAHATTDGVIHHAKSGNWQAPAKSS